MGKEVSTLRYRRGRAGRRPPRMRRGSRPRRMKRRSFKRRGVGGIRIGYRM